MIEGKEPLLLTILAAVLFVAVFYGLQPYSGNWPGRAYARPAQQYVRAAMRQLWSGHTLAWTG